MSTPIRTDTFFKDFRVLLMLFISFRVLLMIVYQPILSDGGELGIGAGGDRFYHYLLTEQVEFGMLPFRDWWSEFPPLWYLTTTLTYLLIGENANYSSWAMLLGIIMVISETGNLIMVRNIGGKLHGQNTGMALAWVYALSIAPVVFMWWNFDSLVTFFLLWGVWLLLQKKDARSAVSVAIGALFKFVPVLIFGAVLRFREYRKAAVYIAITIGIFILAYLPFFAMNSDMTMVSLTAQFNKNSYQTIWALIDGNYGTGNFGAIETHLYPEGVFDVGGNPPVIPGIVRLGLAAAVGLFVLLRTKRLDDVGLVAFVGITLLIFYLQSQGWSPQWLTQIIPLVILVFPTRTGILITIVLTVLAFGEYPFLFIRTGDTETPGIISGELFAPWVGLILARTALLIAICFAFYGKLRQEPIPTEDES